MSYTRIPRMRRRLFVPFSMALLLVAITACVTYQGRDSDGRRLTVDSAGVVAYVDEAGCIARVSVSDPANRPEPYCPPTRTGVSALTWVGSNSLIYVTPETSRQGWRRVNFITGKDEEVPVDEAPRILQTTGAAQVYSIHGERIDIDPSGTVFRVDDSGERAIVLRRDESEPATTAPRLATWSPDGEWVLLERSAENSLWAVRRDGTDVRELAASSRRGLFSWYMPLAGVMPHADLTCSLPTAETWECDVSLRAATMPVPGQETTLSWSTCPGATGYEVELSAPGREPVTNVVAGTWHRLTAESLGNVPTEGWTWRVRPLIGTQAGRWSQPAPLTSGAD